MYIEKHVHEGMDTFYTYDFNFRLCNLNIFNNDCQLRGGIFEVGTIGYEMGERSFFRASYHLWKADPIDYSLDILWMHIYPRRNKDD
jgi:hypothetical protein